MSSISNNEEPTPFICRIVEWILFVVVFLPIVGVYSGLDFVGKVLCLPQGILDAILNTYLVVCGIFCFWLVTYILFIQNA